MQLLQDVLHAAAVHVFISSSVAFFIVGGLFTYLVDRAERRQGRLLSRIADHYFPLRHWRTAHVRVDIVFVLMTKFTQGYIAVVSTFAMVLLAEAIQHALDAWLHQPAKPASGLSVMLPVALAMYVFGDLGEFVSHLMQHTIKPLWEFHKVHHAPTFLTPLTTYRIHPISKLLDAGLMGLFAALTAGSAAYLFGLNVGELFLLSGTVNLAFTAGLGGILQHTHFPISFGPLDRLFISPVMHQVHHSAKPAHWNKNYGWRFSIWDWCIGTAFILPKGERINFGLGEAEDQRGEYSRILWCYVGPFINCGKMLRQRRRNVRGPGAASV